MRKVCQDGACSHCHISNMAQTNLLSLQSATWAPAPDQPEPVCFLCFLAVSPFRTCCLCLLCTCSSGFNVPCQAKAPVFHHHQLLTVKKTKASTLQGRAVPGRDRCQLSSLHGRQARPVPRSSPALFFFLLVDPYIFIDIFIVHSLLLTRRLLSWIVFG